MTDETTSSPQVQYLRRMGFDQAADALEAADALIPTPEPHTRQGEAAPDMQRQHDPQRQATASQLAEAERQAEGRILLDAAKASMPDLFKEE
jgi:hypothetical protein